MSLPHRYPFRWVDPPSSSEVDAPPDGSGEAPARRRVVLTANASYLRRAGKGHGSPQQGILSPFMALEILAQAAAEALTVAGADASARAGTTEGRHSERPPERRPTEPGKLAAIDGATLDDRLASEPLTAGDVLDVEVRVTANFGRLLKVRGVVRRRGEEIIAADLVLSKPS